MGEKEQVKYPESEKMLAVQKDSQAVGEFVEWLLDHDKLALCDRTKIGDDDYYEYRYDPAFIRIEALLAEYFDIDLKKVEKEKMDLLKSLREKHGN